MQGRVVVWLFTLGIFLVSKAVAQVGIFCFAGFDGISGACEGSLLGSVNNPQDCCFSENSGGLGGGSYVDPADDQDDCVDCKTFIEYFCFAQFDSESGTCQGSYLGRVNTVDDCCSALSRGGLGGVSYNTIIGEETCLKCMTHIEVGFLVDSYTLSEEAVNVTFMVDLRVISAQLQEHVEIDFSTADGTATAGADYQEVVNLTLIFSANTTTSYVTVNIINDTLLEDDEQFFAYLRPISKDVTVTVGSTKATVTIEDEDVARVCFEQAEYTVQEGAAVEVCVIKDVETAISTSVNLITEDESAESPADYIGSNFTAHFGTEAGTKFCQNILTVLDNTTEPANITFLVNVVTIPGSPLQICTPNTTRVFITGASSTDEQEGISLAVIIGATVGAALVTITVIMVALAVHICISKKDR